MTNSSSEIGFRKPIINDFITPKTPAVLYEKIGKRKFKSKLNELVKVRKILEKIFKEKDLTISDLELTSNEYKILLIILKKKFGKNISFSIDVKKTLDIENYRELFARFIELRFFTTKRVEEKNKFIYKFTLKKLKNRYFKEHDLKNNKPGE